MTDEQYNLLKEATPHFLSAKRECIRNAPRWLTEQIVSVYEAVTGKTVVHKDFNCAVCVLRIYQLVGKLFDEETRDRAKTLNEENAKDNTITAAVSKPDSGDKEKNKRSPKKDKKGTK